MRSYRHAPWGLAAATGGWVYELGAAHLAALGLVLISLLAVWPLLFLLIVFGLPTLPLLCVPPSWRRWYRHRYERPAVPARIRRATLAADRHRCLYCWRMGVLNPVQLQWDHVRPYAHGGLLSLWNGATLCGQHNRIKSDYWVYPTGHPYYQPFRNAANEALAADILRVELRARRNPLRWLRAAWAV